MTSFKAEFKTGNDPKWYSNSVRLPDREQALAYATNLYSRWTQAHAYQVVESDDPPNYTYEQNGLRPYSLLAQSMMLDVQKGGIK